MQNTTIKFFLLERGFHPLRNNVQDAGADLGARAIVSQRFSSQLPYERETLFDFKKMPDSEILASLSLCGRIARNEVGSLVFHLFSNRIITIGLGVVVEIPESYAGYVEPRSSTVSLELKGTEITIINQHVPIDSGFRGEIIAEIKNSGPNPLIIGWTDRLCQLTVKKALTGESSLKKVDSIRDLSPSMRGAKCAGSSGV